MTHLEKLDVTNRVLAVARPRYKIETVEYRRKKLIANIEEQIELALLTMDGKPRQLERKRGHNIVSVRPRIWWKDFPDDGIYTEIRYNKVAINFNGKGTAIKVGALKKLPTIFRTVIKAVKAGELDQLLESIGKTPKSRIEGQ